MKIDLITHCLLCLYFGINGYLTAQTETFNLLGKIVCLLFGLPIYIILFLYLLYKENLERYFCFIMFYKIYFTSYIGKLNDYRINLMNKIPNPTFMERILIKVINKKYKNLK